MKIIIMSPIPLTTKIYQDFYIQKLTDNGVEIEFWDFSQMFNHGDLKRLELSYANTVKIDSKKIYKSLLSQNDRHKDILIISSFTFCFKFLFIYTTLRYYKFKLISFARGALPSFTGSMSSSEKKIDLLKKILYVSKWKNIIQTLYILGLKKAGFTKKPQLIFQAGSNGHITIGAGYWMDIKSAEQLININYFDYDKYLSVERAPKDRSTNKKHVVFLDEFLPHHPDFDLLGMKKLSAEIYYTELNNFFRYVETLTGLPVLIAAHPKAIYDINPFHGRKIVHNSTVESVAECSLILAHGSTSIGFGVCYNKPIVLMSSSEIRTLNNGHIQYAISGFESILGLIVIDISSAEYKIDLARVIVDDQKYTKYKYSFLTSQESEDALSQDIILNTFKEQYGI